MVCYENQGLAHERVGLGGCGVTRQDHTAGDTGKPLPSLGSQFTGLEDSALELVQEGPRTEVTWLIQSRPFSSTSDRA